MQKIQLIWEGFPGSPGYSTFYTRVADQAQHDYRQAAEVLRDAFQGLRTQLPTTVSIRFNPESEVIEDTTGDLVSFASMGAPPLPVTGLASGSYSAPTGAAIEWHTQGIRRSRRVRGRTYIVPLGNVAYEEDGSLTDAVIGVLGTLGTAVADEDGPQFLIWSRPTDTEEGSSHRISSYSVRDRAAVLTSRRD